MRMTRLFFRSLREAPSEATFPSHQLLLRAGFVAQVAAGIFEFLPLGHRVKRKIEDIIRSEMDSIGGQEITMPMVHPAELWQRSGRWYAIGNDMARFQDWAGRELCLGMTHEEVVTDLAARVVGSYRQLPFTLYQIQTKFRDEPRSRGGLIRVREFTMKDAYSFHADHACLDRFYPLMYQSYFNLFRRCGLDAISVASDTGMMGGTMAHEFMAVAPVGEDTLILCDACGYRANRQVAAFAKPPTASEDPRPLETVHTPGTTTIEMVASFLDVPTAETAKAVFLMATVGDDHGEPGSTIERLVFAVVRGDMELNETKLANGVGARALRPATVEEIRAIGAEPGFGSPVGIDRSLAIVVVDDLVARSPNLVGGANQLDHHYRNINYGRDYEADLVVDLASAGDGNACCRCGAALRSVRGIEVGNTFKLGTKYSESMGAVFTDATGDVHPMVMGCYGIGSGRLMASVVEQLHDDDGICWPVTIAPYEVHLLALGVDRAPEVAAAADQLYALLQEAEIEVLYDDRLERPGVKFNDADLVGLPLRLTVGKRGLDGGTVELKERFSGAEHSVPLADTVTYIQALLARMYAEVDDKLIDEPLEE